MKKNYNRPQLTVIALSAAYPLMAYSGQPEEDGDNLRWDNPEDSFGSDEEVA